MNGRVHSFHTLSAIDGPGLRFVLFMQGCHLRCRYCHNPDSWELNSKLEYSPDEMFRIIDQYKEYFTDGGLTVSGGEPLLQQEFLTELFTICKDFDYHTAIDTAGSVVDAAKNTDLLNVTDLFIVDIKEANPEKYKKLTGADLQVTIDNVRELSKQNKEMWIRYVLVPTVTDDLEDVKALRKILDELETVSKIIVQPYSTLGVKKWEALNIPYTLQGIEPPTPELVSQVNEILTKDYRFYKK